MSAERQPQTNTDYARIAQEAWKEITDLADTLEEGIADLNNDSRFERMVLSAIQRATESNEDTKRLDWLVNPNHLHCGTAHDNAVEAVARGFWPEQKGEHNGNAKRRIESSRFVVQPMAYRQLADQYGISKTQVGNIKNRLQWNHL